MSGTPPFKAAWWLKNPHLQTILPTFLRRRTPMKEKWERLELFDGDFLDLVWDAGAECGPKSPIVLLLHGLGGSVESPYAKGLMRAIANQGMRPVLMHFRGCSGEPNRLARGYHSGDTKDLEFVISHLMGKYPEAPVAAAGISLGANVLLKWLGETSDSNPLKAAVAVSPPFVLSVVADKLMHGFSRFYQWSLINKLLIEMEKKFQTVPSPLIGNQWESSTNFWEFDDLITAKLFDFKDVHEYYQKSSCRQYLPSVRVPTLIIHSKDDPFLVPDAAPKAEELSPSITFELTEKGGHVGFISGKIPGMPHYWLEDKIPEFLVETLNSASIKNPSKSN